MRRNRSEAAIIKACAAELGISERQARNLREKNDPRWQAFVSKMAAEGAKKAQGSEEEPLSNSVAAEAPPPTAQSSQVITGIPGLDAEIDRLSQECLRAYNQYKAAVESKQPNPLIVEATLGVYTKLLEAYRRIAKDTPTINEENNRLIDIEAAQSVWSRLLSELAITLEALPATIQSLVPPEAAIDVGLTVEEKIRNVMGSLSRVQIAQAA